MRKSITTTIAILAVLATSGTVQAQISVSSSHIGGVGAFKKGEMAKLKALQHYLY